TCFYIFFFFQAEDGIRDFHVTGVQTCALPISGTIRQYRYMITTLISAAVGDGVPLEKLMSLAVAVHPDQVVRALHFLAARAGGTVTSTMLQMMIRALVIAGLCQLPEAALAELDAIWENLLLHAPPELRLRHMARKNRVLLERL